MKRHTPKTATSAWCGARVSKLRRCKRCIAIGVHESSYVEYRRRMHGLADVDRTRCGLHIAPREDCERCPIEKRRQTASSLEALGKIKYAH